MYMKNYRKSGKFEQPEENEDGKTAEFLSNFTVCCRQNLHHLKEYLRRTIKIYVRGTTFSLRKNVNFWRIHRVLGGCKGFFEKMNEFPKKFTICFSFLRKHVI